MNLEVYFTELGYLKNGTPRQQAAFQTLQTLNLFPLLSNYDPILVGTIPINVYLPSSDLDIICSCDNLIQFEKKATQEFGEFNQFKSQFTKINSLSSVIINFIYNNFEFEIFCQKTPTRLQNAFLHMIVEERLLRIAGPSSRDKIRDLKSKGMKTEPAFAKLFSISGDSYQALAELYYASDEELHKLVNRKL